eukprot:2625832-Rhodomonas_salina.1
MPSWTGVLRLPLGWCTSTRSSTGCLAKVRAQPEPTRTERARIMCCTMLHAGMQLRDAASDVMQSTSALIWQPTTTRIWFAFCESWWSVMTRYAAHPHSGSS